MRRYLSLLLITISLLFAPVLCAAPIWSGANGEFSIQWTTEELSAQDAVSKKTVFSARKNFNAAVADMDADCKLAPTSSREESIRLLSLVGPLMSIEDFSYVNGGGAHPMLHSRIMAYDLRSPSSPALLMHYFDPQQIFEALKRDGLIKKTFEALKLPPPKTLQEIANALSKTGSIATPGKSPCAFGYAEDLNDLLGRFAFHHIEGENIAVRIGLSHGMEICRGSLVQIGIVLPIPASLMAAMKTTGSGKEGLLMDRLKNRKSLFEQIEGSSSGKAGEPVTGLRWSCPTR